MHKSVKQRKRKASYKRVSTNDYNVYYCILCNKYVIYKRSVINKENHYYCHRCVNCNHPFIQNVYVDEVKFYFDPTTATRKTKVVGTNPSIIKTRNYSWKIIKDMANKE